MGTVAATTTASFTDLLRSHRVRAGLTQQALADLSTVSPRTIRDLEAGRAHGRSRTIHLLADALKLQGLLRELFVHAGSLGRSAGTPDTPLEAPLPKPVNALLGRDPEVRAMVDVLESGRRRMISISGLPGVGKTRVAAEIAARLGARRRWPILWIGTGSRVVIKHGAALSPLLRSLRSLLESETEEVSRVCRLIGQHEVLLVLDGIADVSIPWAIEEVLAYCPGIRVISTSRAPWHVTGLRAAVISPLATPADACGEPGALACVPSVRLLVDRLAEVRPGFTLGPANAASVARLCRSLDGIPAALEAAAGRFRLLGLEQLAAMASRDLLDLTVTSSSGVRQTLGDLIGSSVARLEDTHRMLLRRLAPADRTWTVPEVAARTGRPLDEVMDDLTILIGHGLVRACQGEQATDLTLPNLLRAFLTR